MPPVKVAYNVKKKMKDLKFWDKNPNEMDIAEFEALKQSMEKFGFIEPIVIDEKGRIIGGNHRATVIYQMGGDKAEVICTVISGLSEEDKDKLGLALNKIHGTNNPDKLKALIASFEMPDEILKLGFAPEELELLNIDTTAYEPGSELFETMHQPSFKMVTCPQCGHTFEAGKYHAKYGRKKLESEQT